MLRLPASSVSRLVFAVLVALAIVALHSSDARADERTDVVVFINSPGAQSAPPAVRAAEVQAASGAVLAPLGEDVIESARLFKAVPGFIASLTADEIAELESDSRVALVMPDFKGEAADEQSDPLIQLDLARNLGYTGDGVTVAVIDSGIAGSNPDFAGAVIHEECFMYSPFLSTRCPDGSMRQTGPGAAMDDLGHGTHVAGIIGSRGAQAPLGFAPDVNIEAFKVIDRNGILGFSDAFYALDHILFVHPEVSIINMSFGTFDLFGPGDCDPDYFFDYLRESGVLSVASAGNLGRKTELPYPACVSSVTSVGAVYDVDTALWVGPTCIDSPAPADTVACWSNSNETLDLLAPGCQITSSGVNPLNPRITACGTSMAAPGVAGLAALLSEQRPDDGPFAIEHIMKLTGVPISDPDNNVTTPRINAFAALNFEGPVGGSVALMADTPTRESQLGWLILGVVAIAGAIGGAHAYRRRRA